MTSTVSGPSSFGPNVRTCPWAEGFKSNCPDQSAPPVTSARDYIQRAVDWNGQYPCLGWRPSQTESFKWINYEQFGEAVRLCSASLARLGLKKGDCVGIYARNCPQWTIIQYGSLYGGFVPVPIYDTLGSNIVEYVCNHAQVKAAFVSCDNFENLNQVREKGKMPTVRKVIVIGNTDIIQDNDIDKCVEKDSINLISIYDFIEKGKDRVTATVDVGPDDSFVIMYTSGTTGDPKGVVLTNRNFISSMSSAIAFFKKYDIHFKPHDSFLSYLPLAHIFEQQVQAIHIASGCSIGFYSGNVKSLSSDMESLNPTKFIGVPRVFARFQEGIEQTVESSSYIKQTLFKWAYQRQLRPVQQPSLQRSWLCDKLIFNKIRDKLLPNAKLCLTGSAPMSAQTNDFLNVCLNVPVVQGYGLTETVGGMSCSAVSNSVSGNVGGPLPGAHIKLVDLPEMNYFTSDDPPRGEIRVKGDFVFKEYHDNEQATKDAFDEDGFFKTGDVGQWLPDGSLQIIDRAKNIFKLSQGEYISPDPLEQEFAKCKLVSQIFVYGNSLKDNLVAVVIPDVQAAKSWGDAHGVSAIEEVVEKEDFKEEVIAQLAEMRAKSGMKKFETIKKVLFDISELNDLGQGFHIDNDLMTPSFKLKRPQLKMKYGERLDALYEE